MLATLASLALLAAPSGTEAVSRKARLDGAAVHYQSAGTGPRAVVLVHGWTCDGSFWRHQVAPLAQRTRVLVVDLPGHGQSDKSARAYSMPYLARGILAVLDQEHIEQAVLVGHSMGALVIRHALALDPRRVRGLVLVDGSLRPFFKTAAEGAKFRERYQPDYPKAAGAAIDSMTGPMRKDDAAWVKAAMLATPAAVSLSAMEHMHDPATYSSEPIGVPLAAIQADSAYWAGYEAFLRALQPKLDYRVIAGTSHFVMIDKPAEFNTALIEVLERQGLLAPSSFSALPISSTNSAR